MADEQETVLEALRALTGVRVDSVRTRPAARPIFTGLALDPHGSDTVVEVTLRSGDQLVVGDASGPSTEQALARTAAVATLEALALLLPDDVRPLLDWVRIVEAPLPDEPDVVHSVLTLPLQNPQQLVGAALVRGPVQDAAVRATLAALNRRISTQSLRG